MPAETLSSADLATEILLLIGPDPPRAAPGQLTQAFHRCTRDQLLEMARRLGLTGVSKLQKEVLAGRVQLAFENLPRAHADTAHRADAQGAGGGDVAQAREVPGGNGHN